MPSLLTDYEWRIHYASDTDNPIADFYIPALERSVQYDRKAGFFNSSILSRVVSGLGAMLHQQGTIRLILSCHLNRTDLEAIKQGYALRETVAQRLDADLQPPKNFAQLKHFEILSWLIQVNRLDIRIAIPLKRDGHPQLLEDALDLNHIFHEKVSIFTDANGNQIATNGSGNESLSGWQYNIESFHVYCSWEGKRDLERVQEEVVRFEQVWGDQMPYVKTFAVPEAIKRRLLRYAPSQQPHWTPAHEIDTRPIPATQLPEPERIHSDPAPVPLNPAIAPDLPPSPEHLHQEQEQWQRLINFHRDPACLTACLDSLPIQPWPHQIKILRHVAQTFPRSFLIADEVGLGKTIETGLILRYLLITQKAKRILVLAPASVQPQWQSELREKFNLHFWSYSQGQLIDPYQQVTPLAANPWNSQSLILASSHLVRRQERMAELLAAEPWDLVVVDEAHHARRKTPQARKDTPNRLLELLRHLKDHTQALLLLSATPMQIDAIEIFDLLSLLGLSGHWRYGDAFCDYFTSLSRQPDETLLKFWQTMSADYFRQGGQPSARFQAYLHQKDRLLASKVDDFWRGRFPLIHAHLYLQDTAFLQTSQQYLTVNTPLKDLMFRHTRDTLRQYYRLGLLSQDIPKRHVEDNAIVLNPGREVDLYRQVSTYVRDFYNLAQKENRKALGFLMTLYRKRLTSSFYAIQASLQRRLEALSARQGSGLTDDDLIELDDADDAIIEGLESFLDPVHPQEIEYLETLLQAFATTGEDSKFSHLVTTLRHELNHRESVLIFTQYTDTMDFLREELSQVYGSQVACYSGRGGELRQAQQWAIVPKERIKQQFRAGEIKILLCTESASEGLNLQTCGVLINYDMPWNPMRVEQRIGRIDRIGQTYPSVTIHNFYYDGTVEAKVYKRLRDRIQAFETVVGSLQPILAKVPTFLEQATMSADPEETDVLLSQFEQVLATPPLQPALDDMVKIDVEADLEAIRQPLPPNPFTPTAIETLFTTAWTLKQQGYQFHRLPDRTWQLTRQNQTWQVTFDPSLFNEKPSLRLLSWGEPLFTTLLTIAQSSPILSA